MTDDPRPDDTDRSLEWIDSALRSLRGPERNRMMLRKARALSSRGAGDRSLDVCRELIAADDIHPSLLQAIAEIAHDEDDAALQRRALELIIAGGDADAKREALERFADLVFDTLGDRRGAVESWKAAAQLCDGSPAGQEHAQLLYERALETWADDAEARHELAELHIRSGDWSKIPDALKVLIRVDQDLGRCVLLLLRLEESAVMARALGEFLSLVDELMERLPRESPDQIRALTRARARVLAVDPAREADASKAYRALIKAFESADDIRDFEAFVESRPGADDRHQDRRWLYQWRAAHSPRPGDVLREWGRAEEEYGEPAAALAVYERLAESPTGRKVAQEALSRLKFHSGDMAGGLAAYRALREDHGVEERAALDLKTARRLLEELGRPIEAAAVLAPTLVMRPPIREARELALQILADPMVGDEVGERFAQIANTVDDASALHLFELLVSSPMVSSPRRRDALIELLSRIEAIVGRPLAADEGQWELVERALGVLSQRPEVHPEFERLCVLWARAQVAMGHAHQALSALYDAAERNGGKRSPLLASIYLEIGRAHLAVDEIVEAFSALESGFEVDARAGDIAMLLGLVALDLGDEKTAQRALSSVTTLPSPTEAQGPGADASAKATAFYHLASLASAKGDLAKARRLVSKAIDTDPGQAPARALLSRLDSRRIATTVPGK